MRRPSLLLVLLFPLLGDAQPSLAGALELLRPGPDYDLARNSDSVGSTEKRAVIVGKTKHRGYYDLLVRDRTTKKTESWRWNGTSYARR
ncbi:MAG TPA: hypothetical protein VND45_02800 [Thermoanaerobaculia bacterium]|nr:hypothetical protein [Thermoanaerobaculia bacterium]